MRAVDKSEIVDEKSLQLFLQRASASASASQAAAAAAAASAAPVMPSGRLDDGLCSVTLAHVLLCVVLADKLSCVMCTCRLLRPIAVWFPKSVRLALAV